MIADSSVLIDYVGRQRGRAWQLLEATLSARDIVCVTPEILQETLQGARNDAHFQALRRGLAKFTCLASPDMAADAVAAARLCASARWAGITPRSPLDCSIAVAAVRHGMALLTEDRDFEALRKVEPRLRLIDVPRPS
jgi:predicted nucleic acid-binding protein